jgi:hypothetical protein
MSINRPLFISTAFAGGITPTFPLSSFGCKANKSEIWKQDF